MKISKLFFLITNGLVGILLISACSKSGVKPKEKTLPLLLLTASATEITVGDEVTFSSTSEGENIDADIYIGSQKINSSKHTFADVGTYLAVAKKEGYTDSKEAEITVKAPLKKVAKITFNKVNTAPYTPAYGNGIGRIAMNKNYIYTYSGTTEKFKRYSLQGNIWEELNHTSQIAHAGLNGQLQYVEEALLGHGALFYLSDRMYAYMPREFGGRPDLRNTWRAANVPGKHQSGERAAATDGKHLYFVGNQRVNDYASNIDRYIPDTDTWQTLAQLPVAVRGGAMATIHNKKMYIAGAVRPTSGSSYSVLYVFDIEQLTVHNIPLTHNMERIIMYYDNKHLVVYENYLLCIDRYGSIYVFDIATNQWLEDPVEVNGMFDDDDYSNFMSPVADKLYAAGTLGGNFVLYELKFSVTNE